jgi:hypothetical protein
LKFLSAHDAFVCCAGVVTEGHGFVALIDRVVGALERLSPQRRPVCWFLAGAALLPLDASGRLGVDLPRVRDTNWPHRVNHERLRRTDLDWRLLCPGPMVDRPAHRMQRLHVAIEGLPAPMPASARWLPGALVLPMFAMRIPEMIVPYADAAAVIVANLRPSGPMSRHRLGLALPAGMKGRKDRWAAGTRRAG